jgi:rhodanese-related sulfurtransferase
VSSISDHLAEVQGQLQRLGPHQALAAQMAGALLVDIRPEAQRRRYGAIPGALVIERNVLEWRMDPTSPDRHPAVTDPPARVVVVCQAGYASSLAAVSLQGLGLADATDLEGGFAAWAAAGLPVVTSGDAAGDPG